MICSRGQVILTPKHCSRPCRAPMSSAGRAALCSRVRCLTPSLRRPAAHFIPAAQRRWTSAARRCRPSATSGMPVGDILYVVTSTSGHHGFYGGFLSGEMSCGSTRQVEDGGSPLRHHPDPGQRPGHCVSGATSRSASLIMRRLSRSEISLRVPDPERFLTIANPTINEHAKVGEHVRCILPSSNRVGGRPTRCAYATAHLGV
jgi:hypothetical protein